MELCAAASVDGLTEASRQSRVCGGVANEVMCAVFRVLMEVRPAKPSARSYVRRLYNPSFLHAEMPVQEPFRQAA